MHASGTPVFGEVLDEEAARRGLVWKSVAADGLAAEAGRLAQHAAARDPERVTRTKHTMAAVAAGDDPAGAAALELAAPRWSTVRPGFQASLEDRRARLGRPGRTGG